MKTKATTKTGCLHDPIDDIDNIKIHFSEFGLKETVYLITDYEQLQRLITEIQFRGNGEILYTVTCGTTVSSHYDYEISREENILKKTS